MKELISRSGELTEASGLSDVDMQASFEPPGHEALFSISSEPSSPQADMIPGIMKSQNSFHTSGVEKANVLFFQRFSENNSKLNWTAVEEPVELVIMFTLGLKILGLLSLVGSHSLHGSGQLLPPLVGHINVRCSILKNISENNSIKYM